MRIKPSFERHKFAELIGALANGGVDGFFEQDLVQRGRRWLQIASGGVANALQVHTGKLLHVPDKTRADLSSVLLDDVEQERFSRRLQ